MNVISLEAGNTQVLWAAFDFSQQDEKIEGKSVVGDENCVGIMITIKKPYCTCTPGWYEDPMATLTFNVVVISQSRNSGKTTERGLSPRIIVGVMFVTLMTDKVNLANNNSYF